MIRCGMVTWCGKLDAFATDRLNVVLRLHFCLACLNVEHLKEVRIRISDQRRSIMKYRNLTYCRDMVQFLS